MFAPVRYIEWATKFYGKVPFDLATSGIPYAAWSELGVPEPPLDDLTAYARFREAIAVYNDVTPPQVVPALERFEPEVILLSAGFDAHELDPLAGMRMTTPGFGRLVGVRHAAEFERGPTPWRLPSMPPGSHRPEWAPLGPD